MTVGTTDRMPLTNLTKQPIADFSRLLQDGYVNLRPTPVVRSTTTTTTTMF